MFLEICMQIHTLLFVLSRQINKQKYAKTLILLCAGNKDFAKYQAQVFFFSFNPLFAYALGTEYKLKYQRSKLGYRRKIHSTLRHSSS